ncbi:MAG: aminotransferase class V-fold PLP-dependent enzyme [Brockia lithotrophica]|nr:aminotransferase class V-fold PLP-dependent enzyme [Brockia lithotrophica]
MSNFPFPPASGEQPPYAQDEPRRVLDPTRHRRAPILEALAAHSARTRAAFHIPGHKGGRGMDPEFRRILGDKALAFDLINIAPLDDLHAPTGAIREAEALAAELYAAEDAFFSVQGTTTAIEAMLLAALRPGEKVLLPRNVHKSVLSGLILSGAIPVFLAPEADPVLGILHGLTPEVVARALDEHPDARALLLVHPTYYGTGSPLETIVSLAHSRGIPVLVDAAHGAHLPFHPDLPVFPTFAGADLVAVSMHKLGGALTQASLLLRQGSFVPRERVRASMNLLQTTSSSYLLLASLDAARRFLALEGRRRVGRAVRLALRAREEAERLGGLYIPGPFRPELGFSFDPTKFLVHVADLGLSGAEVERILRERFAIEVELSDPFNVLFVISVGDTEQSIDLLLQALEYLVREEKRDVPKVMPFLLPPEAPLVISPREAYFAEGELVPLEEAEGRISGEAVVTYPPGIPLVLPGERWTSQLLAYLEFARSRGVEVRGTSHPKAHVVRVVVE